MAEASRSGTPLAAKLGVRPGSRLLVDSAPAGWLLPESPVVARRRARPDPYDVYDVVLLFCRDRAVLSRRFAPLAARLTTAGALWVCWPKTSSGVVTDLGDRDVREYGLGEGLVDVKVAAVDATWSGLKFVRRLQDR